MTVAQTRFMLQNEYAPGVGITEGADWFELPRGVRLEWEYRRWSHFQHASGLNARGVSFMADYTIAAIPTLYRGRMYRSRLEARWAAFFDRLGWAYEYEPFDLGSWSPDFLLIRHNVMVEVKPLTEFDQGVADKMLNATVNQRIVDEEVSPCGLFLTRVAPFAATDKSVSLGWLCPPAAPSTFGEAIAFWRTDIHKPCMHADVVVIGAGGVWTMDGDARPDSDGFSGWFLYPKHTMGLWSDASNAVQWERGQ